MIPGSSIFFDDIASLRRARHCRCGGYPFGGAAVEPRLTRVYFIT
ncbi:hypothetical protein FHR47_000266 [Xanthomonas arboricola]|nr:hypothetical protein [Xanthomonas cannabis]